MRTEGDPAHIDLAGIAAVFDRHADRVHTYCWSRRRDDTAAATALIATLAAVVREAGDAGTDHLGPAVVLGAARREIQGAADEALDASRGRWGRLDRAEPTPVDDRAAGRVLWNLLPDMPRRDHDLVELHFRAGLDGADLAEAMGLDATVVEPMIARVGARVALLIGACTLEPEHECAGWRDVRSRHHDADARAARHAAIHHAERCAICRDAALTAIDPVSAARSMPLVPAPESTRAALLDALTEHRSPGRHDDAVVLSGDPEVDLDLTDDPSVIDLGRPDDPEDDPDADGTSHPTPDGIRLRVLPQTGGAAGLVLGFVLLAVAALLAWPSGSDADAGPDVTVTAEVAGAVATPSLATPEPRATPTVAPTSAPSTTPSTPTTDTGADPGPVGPLFFGSTAPIVVARDADPTAYVFANVGDTSLEWSANVNGPFVVEPIGGVVAPGGTSTILLATTAASSNGPLVDVGVLVLSTGAANDIRIELTTGG